MPILEQGFPFPVRSTGASLSADVGMVCIILVNWRNAKDTIACLESLRHLEFPEFHVIVCDNGSGDGSDALIADWITHHPDLSAELIQTGANLGFAGGNNIGMRKGLQNQQTKFFWLLNNDTEVKPDALSHLVKKMQCNTSIGICGATLLYAHQPEMIQAVGGRYNSWLGTVSHVLAGEEYSPEKCAAIDERSLDYVVGASMLVRRDFIEQVGMMCEDYFLYFEELDWIMRGKRAGYCIAYAPQSLVFHKEGGSTGSGAHTDWRNRSAFADACALRSRILFAKKFYPVKKWSVRLGLLMTAANRFRRGDWRGVQRALRNMV